MNLSKIINEQFSEWKNLNEFAKEEGLNCSDKFAEFLRGTCIENENWLEDMALSLRRQWVNKAHDLVADMFRSPNSVTEYSDLYSKNRYTYERCLDPISLESKLCLKIDGWLTRTLVFSSCMMAINELLAALKFLYRESLCICTEVGYFETALSMKFLLNGSNSHVFTTQLREESIECSDVFFFESVLYDLNLRGFDYVDLLQKIKKFSKKKICVIVIDTTLEGATFNRGEFLRQCNDLSAIVVEVRSLLKLSQQGFEFSNAGIVNIISKPQLSSAFIKLTNLMVKRRNTVGSGISLYELSLLSLNSISQSTEFEKRVQLINRRVAQIISERKPPYIESVSHPSLDNGERNAPFLFIFFKNKDKAFVRSIVKTLNSKLSSMGMRAESGDSFGFRNCRYEPIDFISHISGDKESLLRLSCGNFWGAKLQTILEAICNPTSFLV